MKLVGPISFVTKMKKDSGVLLSGKRSMVLQTQEIQVYKCQHTQRSPSMVQMMTLVPTLSGLHMVQRSWAARSVQRNPNRDRKLQ